MTNGKPLSTGRDELKNFLFNAESLCELIRVCSKSNVKRFDFGDLHLAFGDPDQGAPIQTRIDHPLDETRSKEIAREAELEQAELRVDDEIDNLLVTDPASYEDHLVQEYVNERDSSA